MAIWLLLPYMDYIIHYIFSCLGGAEETDTVPKVHIIIIPSTIELAISDQTSDHHQEESGDQVRVHKVNSSKIFFWRPCELMSLSLNEDLRNLKIFQFYLSKSPNSLLVELNVTPTRTYLVRIFLVCPRSNSKFQLRNRLLKWV